MMTLAITDRIIRSLDTRHTASCRPGAAEWQVTWLPGRILTQDQAAAAMELAEASGQMPADCGHRALRRPMVVARGCPGGRARHVRPRRGEPRIRGTRG